MMKEHTNKILLLVLVAGVIFSVGSSIFVITKLSELSTVRITGYATSDVGYARINISKAIGIEVDPSNNLIDFGTCTFAGQSGTAYISSEMTEAFINSDTIINCTDSNLNGDRFIRVENTGNVQVNLTVHTSQTGPVLLNAAGARIYFKADNATEPGCLAGLEDEWSLLDDSSAPARFNVCSQLDFSIDRPGVDVYINLTIPSEATTTGQETVDLTFWAAEYE